MGWVLSVRQNNSLKVLTGERTCLKIQVLIFCVIDRVCDTQTPPTWHSLQVKSNNGHYLPSLSERLSPRLHQPLRCVTLSSSFPGDRTDVVVGRDTSAHRLFTKTFHVETAWVGSLDLTSVPLMYSNGSFDLTSDSLIFSNESFDLTCCYVREKRGQLASDWCDYIHKLLPPRQMLRI